MTQEEVRNRLNNVFCRVFNDASMVIAENTTPKDIDRWDSLAQMNLISETEEEFEIKFKLQELIAMKNVGDYIKTICAKVG